MSVASPRGRFDEPAQVRARESMRALVAATVTREGVDAVHFHGVDFGAVLPDGGPPALVTLHLPRAWYPDEWLRPGRAATFFNCVSTHQLRSFAGAPGIVGAIDNGVLLSRLRFRSQKSNFALALGRISPEKGLHDACDAARIAGVPLLLGGRVFPYPEHQRYFEREIAPRLGAHCRFAGPLDLRRKRRLLAAARCLLVPSVAPESSSLVAMEALASGTPVIAYSNGALTDIVEPGRTGFLVRGAAEMARAIGDVATISPHACRRSAAARFSAERMAVRYLELYGLLVTRRFDGARDEGPDILRAALNV